MVSNLTERLGSDEVDALGNAFSRLGWGGLVVQVMMGAIPFAIMVYTVLFNGSRPDGPPSALPLVQHFSTIDLVLLVFIVLWFYQYTRIGKRIRKSPSRVSISGVQRSVWIGISGATLAILFSMMVLLFEVGTMLFRFLSAPQAGVAAIQRMDAMASWVSAIDMLNLLSLILTLGGEILALAFGQALLFRTNQLTTRTTEMR